MTPYILVDNYRIVGEIFFFIPTTAVTSEAKMEAPTVTVHGIINRRQRPNAVPYIALVSNT